jgi:NADPH:quinone reductase-like Zn-dependent oxidoreductase
MTVQALQMSRYGTPTDVVEVVVLPEPQAPLAGHVLAAVEYAPINQ